MQVVNMQVVIHTNSQPAPVGVRTPKGRLTSRPLRHFLAMDIPGHHPHWSLLVLLSCLGSTTHGAQQRVGTNEECVLEGNGVKGKVRRIGGTCPGHTSSLFQTV